MTVVAERRFTGSRVAAPAVVPWALAAFLLCGFAVSLTLLSGEFGYDRDVGDMPVLWLTAILVGAGAAFALLLPQLVRKSSNASTLEVSRLVPLMLAAGLVARLILFASEPLLEDDYQRYLWDGGVSASGLNPYAVTPLEVRHAAGDTSLAALKDAAGPVLDRLNHPALRTIYPPVAQAAFAIAHVLAPWSLAAWRTLLLMLDGCVVVILMALLRETGRSPRWAALYWWNPLVLKEAFNSAHMEPLVLALVLLTLWLAIKQRPWLAVTALAFATGAKLWPVLLLPLVLRPLGNDKLRTAGATVLYSGLLALPAAPIVMAGFGDASGFRAYAETWQTNSALFPILESGADALLNAAGLHAVNAALAVKAVLGLALAIFALRLARAPFTTATSLMRRASLIVAALVLLSPAQYPWYLLWLAPFLAFWPNPAFLLLAATIPLYYASFHFAARETLDTAKPLLLALIWVPVWTLLAVEWWRNNGTSSGVQPIVGETPHEAR